MKVIILAGGQGTRLKPITDNIPKILVPIGSKTLLERIRDWLEPYKFVDEVVISAHYLISKIEDATNIIDSSKIWGVLPDEEKPLGTAGAVKQLSYMPDKTFIVYYGDILTDLKLDEMYQKHKYTKSIMTIAVTKSDREDVGKVLVNKNDKVLHFCEKGQKIKSDLINMGIYILDRSVLEIIPQGISDFGKDIIPNLIKSGALVSAYYHSGYYNDIGTAERYYQSCSDVENGLIK